MYASFTELGRAELTLYTDALIARGTVRTRQHRISDILNQAEAPFLVLEDVTVTEYDGRAIPIETDIAQINLDAVLFAVVTTPVQTSPELRSPKTPHDAMISIPPFRVTGMMHLLAGASNLREALGDLTGRFLPITDATYEAPALGLAPQAALMVAVNHHRAQILARYAAPGDRPPAGAATIEDPWHGTGSDPSTVDPWAPPPSPPDADAWGSGSSATSAGADPWGGTSWAGGPKEEPGSGA